MLSVTVAQIALAGNTDGISWELIGTYAGKDIAGADTTAGATITGVADITSGAVIPGKGVPAEEVVIAGEAVTDKGEDGPACAGITGEVGNAEEADIPAEANTAVWLNITGEEGITTGGETVVGAVVTGEEGITAVANTAVGANVAGESGITAWGNNPVTADLAGEADIHGEAGLTGDTDPAGDTVPVAEADGLGEPAVEKTLAEKIKAIVSYDPAAPMIFSSGLFLFLFAGFTLFYGFFRRKPVGRMVYILLFSLYFYYKSSGLYFLLVLLVATTDFMLGLWMGRTENRKLRKTLLWLSILIDLGLLGYFKYTNFFIGIANDLFDKGFLDFQNIFLPVGISFFIFQSISYTIDIYRRRIEPLTCWLDYAFYLSFFPQLVAGPIVRARDFIPQIRHNPLVVTRGMFGTGVFLIVTGLFKKAVISDYISLNFVDRIFDAPLLYSGFENLMGVYGYALQIYCDFSGYSDMAIGIALILGFRFNRNFDSPYKSATITEFWRRWHISLSSWLKDYLYISLGGNRKGKVRTYLNLMITMLLGGAVARCGIKVRFLGSAARRVAGRT